MPKVKDMSTLLGLLGVLLITFRHHYVFMSEFLAENSNYSLEQPYSTSDPQHRILQVLDSASNDTEGSLLGSNPLHVQSLHVQSSEITTPSETPSGHVHVLYGLSGNNEGFLQDFEISLKSVLLNAPIHSKLTIHIMADPKAYIALDDIFNRTNVATWKTLHPIQIQTYNVEPHLAEWKSYIPTVMGSSIFKSTRAHTIGCFFRLFANKVVDTEVVDHILYLDTDVVIMANLDNLWKYTTDVTRKDKLFQWGSEKCSGFLLLNVARMDRIWELASSLDMQQEKKSLKQDPNDQLIFKAIYSKFPEEVAILPPEWDVTMGSKSRLWNAKNMMKKRKDGVGMMHFNGGSGTKSNAFSAINEKGDEGFMSTWGNAGYYLNMPWNWAKFSAESMVIDKESSHPLALHHKIIISSS